MTQSLAKSGAAVLKIGTRGSPLALYQANEVRDRLVAAHGLAPEQIEIVIIKVTGDQILDRPLAEAGGKGLFTKEIEEALLDKSIDLAVHSSKDVATVLPPGLFLSAFLPREDVRDAFISRKAKSLSDLAPGAVVGSASLRRQAMIKRLRPDLKVINFRGNVQSRLRKLDAGEVDATMLAYAGLRRLGLADQVAWLVDVDEFLPAVGQGAICIESREGDDVTTRYVSALDHFPTHTAVVAERAFLGVLDGSCRTPIAGHARLVGDEIRFRGLILRPDGSESYETSRSGPHLDAARLGADAGHELKGKAGPGFFTVT